MKRLVAAIAATVAAVVFGPLARVHACISDQLESIHFNSAMPDFGLPPARGILIWRGEEDYRPGTNYGNGYRSDAELSPERDSERAAKNERAIAAARAAAQRAEANGDWRTARKRYETMAPLGWRPGDRRDLIETLREAEQSPNPRSPALPRYLKAMGFVAAERPADARAAFEAIAADSAAPKSLRARARYQIAALDAEAQAFPSAIAQFEQVARTFPPKREAALIMIARCAVLHDRFYDADAGREAIRRLLADFPRTRFRDAARGLQARIALRENRIDDALRTYFALGDLRSVETVLKGVTHTAEVGPARVRLIEAYLDRLPQATDFDTYEQTVARILRTRNALTAAEAIAFGRNLRRAPDRAATYLYVRLKHTELSAKDRKSVTALADAIAGTDAVRSLSPIVRARLSEAYYRSGDLRRALLWGDRALESGPTDIGLYVRGAARRALKRNAAALADFNAILADYPNSPLRRAARENVAILSERRGDLGAALDQYFALGYKPDIAYIVDIRMTPAELAAYRRTRTHHRDLLTYSLGIRYLRAERFTDAEQLFKQIPPRTFYAFGADRRADNDFDKPSPDPITSAQKLRTLKRMFNNARPADAARRGYEYASFYYRNGTLLLYNGAVWEGMRSANFAFWWNDEIASATDARAVRKHMFEHETYARASHLCREIARRYPRTPYAAPALYRAACAESRLAHFNAWWRTENDRFDHERAAARLMRQLADRYPTHPLAPEARKFAHVWAVPRPRW